MPLVTEAEQAAFRENGYVKLEGVVAEENCQAVKDAIWERLGADPDDPDTWYEPPTGMEDHWRSRSGGMVELTHHQSLWNNRQDPSVYQAFAEIWGEEKLWTSMDRCNMTPPAREEYPELDQSFLHWDADLTPERSLATGGDDLPYGVQGVLFLDTTTEEQGTFQCVPSVFRNLEEWYADHDQEEMTEENYADEIVRVPGDPGDLVIWDTRLAHGNGSNSAEAPRFAQYISMTPADFGDRERRDERVEMWRTLGSFGEDPSEWERRNLDPAELTPLGRKLLGVDPWNGWLDDGR